MNDKCIHIANITGGKWYVQHEQSNRVYSDEGISPTVCTRYDEGMTGFKIMTSDLKKELCNELIEKGMLKEGDMIYHSYTNNRLNGVRDINTVQNKDNSIGATLTTRPDTLGIVVDDSVKLVGGGWCYAI